MRTAVFTGIVLLMTVKPGLDESLIVIATAMLGGILTTLLVFDQRTCMLPRARMGTLRDWNWMASREVQMRSSANPPR
jgi:hypothetical protein